MKRGNKSKGLRKTAKKKERTINYDSNAKVTYQVELTQDEWKEMTPDPTAWKCRNTWKLKKIWTHMIVYKLNSLHKIPCPYKFKKHTFPVLPNSPYITFFGWCEECGNSVNGSMQHEPKKNCPIVLEINTHDTRNLVHETSTRLANERRNKEGYKLEHTKPKRYVDEQAADILNDSGTKPPYFVKESVARTARQEARDKKIGIDKYSKDSVTAILQEMDDEEDILQFGVDPVQIYYWLKNQTILWNEANELHLPISIDATGSIVKRLNIIDDINSSPIFLYNITTRFSKQVFTICQMLSSQHDSGTIAEWLEAWIESGASIPSQVTVDCSWALLIAVCYVFNHCDYFEYNDRCHIYVVEYNAKLKLRKNPEDKIVMVSALPACRTTRDRAHLVKSSCKWKCFGSGQHWTKNDLYVRVIAFCLEIENFEELNDVILALFVVCTSQYFDEDSHCYQQYQFLKKKIATFDHKKFGLDGELNDDSNDNTCNDEHCNFLKEFDADEKSDFVQCSAGDIKSHLSQLQIRSKTLADEDSSRNHSKGNPYWLPAILNNLLRLFREYPSWTNITRPFYSFDVNAVATSTGSEVYFRILKIDYELMRLSLQRLLLQHIKLIKGATRNGRRELIKFKELKSREPKYVRIETAILTTDNCKDAEPNYYTVNSSQEEYCNPLSIEPKTLREGEHVSKLETFGDTERILKINKGQPFPYDVIMAFYDYNLPFTLKDKGCSLTLHAFLSLNSERFVHGEVIDSVMSIWKCKAEWQDVFFVPTTQTNSILGDQCEQNHPIDLIMHNINFNFFGIVFMPFCFEWHWCLVMLNVRKKTLYYFDPKYNHTKKRPVEALRSYFARCKDIMEQKLGILEEVEVNNLSLIEWKTTGSNNDRDTNAFPIQIDSHNCGLFIIHYMALLSGVDDVKIFKPDDYRLYIADLLLREFDVANVHCLYCFNAKNESQIMFCEKCDRWAHVRCVARFNSMLKGACEICS